MAEGMAPVEFLAGEEGKQMILDHHPPRLSRSAVALAAHERRRIALATVRETCVMVVRACGRDWVIGGKK